VCFDIRMQEMDNFNTHFQLYFDEGLFHSAFILSIASKWRQKFLPKCRSVFTGEHDVTSHRGLLTSFAMQATNLETLPMT